MIKEALVKYPSTKIEQSFIVGDATVDVALARNMRMKGFGLGVGDVYQEKNIIQLHEIKDLINYI